MSGGNLYYIVRSSPKLHKFESKTHIYKEHLLHTPSTTMVQHMLTFKLVSKSSQLGAKTSPKPTDAVEGLFREMYILQLKIHQPCVPGIIYTLGLVRLKTRFRCEFGNPKLTQIPCQLHAIEVEFV